MGNLREMRFSLCSDPSIWHSTRYSILFTMLASDSTAALSFSSRSWCRCVYVCVSVGYCMQQTYKQLHIPR
ncbi:hypothetical protein EON65_50670 [archaeon]|nr:MAG: hypothetical protein EON65_50670 [archaeon]